MIWSAVAFVAGMLVGGVAGFRLSDYSRGFAAGIAVGRKRKCSLRPLPPDVEPFKSIPPPDEAA